MLYSKILKLAYDFLSNYETAFGFLENITDFLPRSDIVQLLMPINNNINASYYSEGFISVLRNRLKIPVIQGSFLNETKENCNSCDIDSDNGIKFIDCVIICGKMFDINHEELKTINKTQHIANKITEVFEKDINLYNKVITYNRTLKRLYRVDNRSPKEIIDAKGFFRRNLNHYNFSKYSFYDLKKDSSENNGYLVSTTTFYPSVSFFSLFRKGRYIYEIWPSSLKLIDFVKTSVFVNFDYPYMNEREVASTQFFPLYDIRSCYDRFENKFIKLEYFRKFNNFTVNDFHNVINTDNIGRLLDEIDLETNKTQPSYM